MSDVTTRLRMTRHARGFSLLEVLIALLIFSLGLLGMASLLIVSVKVNQSAYLRTQVSFVAQGMADRIRANKPALRTNAYNGSYSATSAGADPCAAGAVCNVANVVLRDQRAFGQQLADLLPNATADVDCVGSLLGTAAQAGAASYDGLCNMTIRWSETSLIRGNSSENPDPNPLVQSFAWVFQP